MASEMKGTTMIHNLQPIKLSQLNYIVKSSCVCVSREKIRLGKGATILIKQKVVVYKSMLMPLRTNVQNLLYHLSPQKVHFYQHCVLHVCVVISICMGTPV